MKFKIFIDLLKFKNMLKGTNVATFDQIKSA